MRYGFLDASGLAKRYTLEVGSNLIDHLWENVPPERLVCLLLGVGEVISILVRRKNGGQITPAVFAQAMSNLGAEVIQAADFRKFTPHDAQVAASWQFIEKHSVNSTDALVLQAALDYAVVLCRQGHELVLIAADQRLIRAAQAEGLMTFNPETDPQATLDTLLAV